MNFSIKDKELFSAIQQEKQRQEMHIELIASENYVSSNVLKAQGSILTNKYAEGYSSKRYYGGCEFVDKAETLAIERVKKLFDAKYANVQPHSGSSANMAAYRSLIKAGDTVLGMSLDHGGHLTHGHPINFSGVDYNFISYGVDNKTQVLNYEEIRKIALENKPALIVAGASAYSRIIDFKKFKEIADEVNALLMIDMAHIAGLVATGLHPNPIDYADIVTSTTHKTLRGPRGGIILTNNEKIAKKVNKVIFPGIQGGPLMHVIAAKAVAFYEALDPSFLTYQQQIVDNAKTMENEFKKHNVKLVSNGTDNHLLLVDVKTSFNITGKQAEKVLDEIYITCNKNTIPNDTESPFITSGVRLGTPAITTRGFKKEDIVEMVEIIVTALKNTKNEQLLASLKEKVSTLTKKHPLF